MRITICALFAACLAGCTPSYDGEYDGTASLTLESKKTEHADKLPATFAVHVSVNASTVVISGAPLTACNPKIAERSARGMLLDFHASACSVAVAPGKSVPLADGVGIATLEGKKLTMAFNGTDVVSFEATKK